MSTSDSRKATSKAAEQLAHAKRDAYFAVAPFTDPEKEELVKLLLETERLRVEAGSSVMRAQHAERTFNVRYAELVKAHGVALADEPILPSNPGQAIRLVSGPSVDPQAGAELRGCQKIHSCIACDTVCCWAWECGSCEGCHECTIGT
jgi:hypothetical protein